MSSLCYDYEKSNKGPEEHEFRNSFAYGTFFTYGESLAQNLGHGSVVRAYGSSFDQDESWRNWPPSTNEHATRQRSKRHVHLFSKLNNLEIGQHEKGGRSLFSTLLSSDCREFRYDQSCWGKNKKSKLGWMNRRIVNKYANRMVPYDRPNEPDYLEADYPIGTERRASYDKDNIRLMFAVDPSPSVSCAIPCAESYLLLTREIGQDTYLEKFSYGYSTRSEKQRKYLLPRGWRYSDISWKTTFDTFIIEASRRNTNKHMRQRLLLVFQCFPLSYITGLTLDNHAVPSNCSAIQILALQEDIMYILTKNEAILYSYEDVWKRNGSMQVSHDDYYTTDGETPERELPILFDVANLGTPMAIFPGSFQMIQCSSHFPLVLGLENELDTPYFIQDLRRPHNAIDYNGYSLPMDRSGSDFTEFEVFEAKNYSHSIIFPDYFGITTSTFLVYEDCHLVRYNVRTTKRDDGSTGLKLYRMWKTMLFPKVEDRDVYRRKAYEEKYEGTNEPDDSNKKRRSTLRVPPFVEGDLRHLVKICDTSYDEEHVIVIMSIDVAHVTPDGYFDSTEYVKEVVAQFAFIIDEVNGEILRIVPIFGIFSHDSSMVAESVTFHDDLMIINKNFSIQPKMEIWELIEPQQHLYQLKELKPKKVVVKSKLKGSEFWASSDYPVSDEDDDSDYTD